MPAQPSSHYRSHPSVKSFRPCSFATRVPSHLNTNDDTDETIYIQQDMSSGKMTSRCLARVRAPPFPLLFFFSFFFLLHFTSFDVQQQQHRRSRSTDHDQIPARLLYLYGGCQNVQDSRKAITDVSPCRSPPSFNGHARICISGSMSFRRAIWPTTGIYTNDVDIGHAQRKAQQRDGS